MTQYDDALLQLQQNAALKKRLEAKQVEVDRQRRMFEQNVIRWTSVYRSEQKDVDKLEGSSLANYFYQIVGKRDEKLTQEREEALAAKVKLDAAQQEFAAAERQLAQIRSQLEQLQNSERDYAIALEKKRNEVRVSGTAVNEQILELEHKIAALKSQKRACQEAISAGRDAQEVADDILSEMSDADSWNNWDLLVGGGLVTHAAKYDHLDSAQDHVCILQEKLRKFKTELADVKIEANLQVGIGGFLRFADYFFDGVFADCAVKDHINDSQNAVYKVKGQIATVMNRLSRMEAMTDKEIQQLQLKIEQLLLIK